MIKRGTRDFACLSRALIPRNRSGQVWVETIIYTLIAFVMIGLVLSYARPKIEQLQDSAILQQSTDMMKQIDSTILTMGGAGNQRILEIGIKKGDLKIDGVNDKIIFEMETQSLYSEPGKEINDGSVIILTQKETGHNLVTLTLDYSSSNNDLKFEGNDVLKEIDKSSTSYNLLISNEGENANGKTVLNISLS
jgi:type II secretory pathway pseudopilin PulG